MKYISLFLCACCVACNNDSTTTTATDTAATTATAADIPTTSIPADTSACYSYQTSNDLVALRLNTTGQAITGNLEYAFMGKDKNTGTISGAMRGDTLLADYTFQSEGKSSVRQVAFLKKGDSFVEGYGDSKQEGNKMVFKNSGALNFGNMILKKVPCH